MILIGCAKVNWIKAVDAVSVVSTKRKTLGTALHIPSRL